MRGIVIYASPPAQGYDDFGWTLRLAREFESIRATHHPEQIHSIQVLVRCPEIADAHLIAIHSLLARTFLGEALVGHTTVLPISAEKADVITDGFWFFFPRRLVEAFGAIGNVAEYEIAGLEALNPTEDETRIISAAHTDALAAIGEVDSLPLCDGIAFGGTFDGLHFGHVLALTRIVRQLEKGASCAILAATSDLAIQHKPESHFIQALTCRRDSVERFMEYFLTLRQFKPLSKDVPLQTVIRAWIQSAAEDASAFNPSCSVWQTPCTSRQVTIITTDLGPDAIGVAGALRMLDGLMITPECIQGAVKVNVFREAKGFPPVKFLTSPLITPPAEVFKAPELKSPSRVESKASSRTERLKLSKAWPETSPLVSAYCLLGDRVFMDAEGDGILRRFLIIPRLLWLASQSKAAEIKQGRPLDIIANVYLNHRTEQLELFLSLKSMNMSSRWRPADWFLLGDS